MGPLFGPMIRQISSSNAVEGRRASGSWGRVVKGLRRHATSASRAKGSKSQVLQGRMALRVLVFPWVTVVQVLCLFLRRSLLGTCQVATLACLCFWFASVVSRTRRRWWWWWKRLYCHLLHQTTSCWCDAREDDNAPC
jgi:hypothetical protein